MNLEFLYHQILENIKKINFDSIWKGFVPTKFALYTQFECYFDGKYIDKTSDFIANTAIFYNGEYIAIWNVMEQIDIAVLTSKIIHEMFHAYQMSNDWEFSNELDALMNYQYDERNLSIKFYENKLLLDLYESYDSKKNSLLQGCRKYRQENFPYEFQYECRVESIEGSANYVEWQVLKQIDPEKGNTLYDVMKNKLVETDFYFPIRLSNYYSGALYYAVQQIGETIVSKKTLVESIDDIPLGIDTDIAKAVLRYKEDTMTIVTKAIDDNQIILDEPVKLLGLNVYDARRYQNYLTSTFFLMLMRNEKEEILNGNFVIKMLDAETICTVYKWN